MFSPRKISLISDLLDLKTTIKFPKLNIFNLTYFSIFNLLNSKNLKNEKVCQRNNQISETSEITTSFEKKKKIIRTHTSESNQSFQNSEIFPERKNIVS